jgi:BlaI family penicillinase repressor
MKPIKQSAKTKQLGDLQISIMRVLWDLGEATVAQVQSALKDEREFATTTVATVLTRLEKSGLISHHTVDRQFVYRPLVTKIDLLRNIVSDLADKLFRGDKTALVSHLLTETEINKTDLKRVKAMIEAKEKKVRHGQ